MYRRKPKPKTLAVSEVLGFILIFALVLSSVTLIYTQAYPTLQEQKDSSVDRNVERSLSILQQNFNTVFRGEAPSRGTELKVADSKLTIRKKEYNITYSLLIDGNYSNVSISPEVFVYETETGTQYYYLQGSIVHSQDDQVYFVEKYDDTKSYGDALQLSLIGMEHTGGLVSGGTNSVVVEGGDGQVFVYRPANGNETINVSVIMETPNTAERNHWREHYRKKPSFQSCKNINATAFKCTSAPYSEIIISYRFLTYEYL